ncbi:hypothetical protein QFC22_002521 [Naganishia vaughanmartiniae]|uniref:Uncharacterized protein n=1 Tax=Naganishia vaughanmartiniae TaxID=1424756 RepID=A0ACC2X9K2_9TREE|nr:hypothetical protein QFC22_002521 [Naganishia vaughanmartiniae]
MALKDDSKARSSQRGYGIEDRTLSPGVAIYSMDMDKEVDRGIDMDADEDVEMDAVNIDYSDTHPVSDVDMDASHDDFPCAPTASSLKPAEAYEQVEMPDHPVSVAQCSLLEAEYASGVAARMARHYKYTTFIDGLVK